MKKIERTEQTQTQTQTNKDRPRKLRLQRETLRALVREQLGGVVGGCGQSASQGSCLGNTCGSGGTTQ